jgi:hypothetical protein
VKTAGIWLQSGQFSHFQSVKNNLDVISAMEIAFAVRQTTSHIRSKRQVWDGRRKEHVLAMRDAMGRHL